MKKGPSVKYTEYTTLGGTKESLVQQVGSGSIIKRFDKTPHPTLPGDIVCPHFLELKWAYGCPYRCACCYLQGTLRLLPTRTKPVVKNYKKIKRHIQKFFDETIYNDYIPEILNSGEIADSLMWEDNGSPFSEFIVSLFETQTKHKVLFLSKSDKVDNLVRLGSDRILPSLTLNANHAASRWERGAPSVKKRIEAAGKLSDVGYPVRIRIDPLVPINDWEEEYVELIDDVFSRFKPERITLGSLRGLISTINNAYDKSWVRYLKENSNWGKKIDFETRYSIYSTIVRYLKENYDYNDVAFCKETKKMWTALLKDYTKIKCNCIF
jgi:spore photoproduct lyase